MKFQIKAVRDSFNVVSVVLDAADEADAERQAKSSGLAVLSLKRAASWQFDVFTRRARFPLALFAQELLALLEAGLTLVETIEGLAEKEGAGPTRNTLEHLMTQLQQGRTLSQAMQDLPEVFPSLFVATVRATERTGDLPDALKRYIAYQAQLETVRKKIVSASIYPLLLIAVGSLVLLFLLGYVVPKFSHVYADIHGDLPLLSRLLLEAGKFLEANGMIAGAVFLVICFAVVRLLMLPQTRRWIGARLWAMPSLGSRMRLYQLARFYRTLGMLVRGGTPMVTALDMSAGLLSPALRVHLGLAAQAIREGRSISEAMTANNLTTPVALRMLRVGERTGRMGEMMERIASFHEDEMAVWVERFTKLFEPLLMIFIGLLIGGVVVLMYFPIFELADSIQ